MNHFRSIPNILSRNTSRSFIRRTVILGANQLQRKSYLSTAAAATEFAEYPIGIDPKADHHAVVSTFDLFSIGVGPSSSHTVGPMRAAKIFVSDLKKHNILERVHTLRVGKTKNLLIINFILLDMEIFTCFS
jgi:hypothetical protein